MPTIMEAAASLSNSDYDDWLHIVNISGGKESAALAAYVRTKYPQIHERAEYVFCDTQCGLEETYEFLDTLEDYLGKPIQRLNALDLLNIRDKPERNPFYIILREKYSGFLPSPRSRWCTRDLKIAPFEKFVVQRQAFSYIWG